MPSLRRLAPAAIALALLLPAAAIPQTQTSPPPDAGTKGCRGRTDGRGCGLRLLTDASGYWRANDPGPVEVRYAVGFAAGLSHSAGARSEVGLAMLLAARDGVSTDLQARYRRWLAHGIVLDAGAGTILSVDHSNMKNDGPGIVGEIGVGYRDWLGLRVRLESVRYGEPVFAEGPPEGASQLVTFRDTAVWLGARTTGWRGLLGGVVLGIAALVAAASVGGAL